MNSYMQEALEARIDFEGQKTVNFISRMVLIMSTLTSFVMGFIFQDLRVTFGLMALATVVLAVVTLPPWSMYNRYPVKWMDSKSKKE